jgi:hypothetical protein
LPSRPCRQEVIRWRTSGGVIFRITAELRERSEGLRAELESGMPHTPGRHHFEIRDQVALRGYGHYTPQAAAGNFRFTRQKRMSA